MIGWSSRNAYASRRRRQWWASLTEEEKALELRREGVENRVFFQVFVVVAVLLFLMWAFAPDAWLNAHPLVALVLYLTIFPGGMVVGALVSKHKGRRIK
jgi:hypothetical protein